MPCTAKKLEAERGELLREGEGQDIGGRRGGRATGLGGRAVWWGSDDASAAASRLADRRARPQAATALLNHTALPLLRRPPQTM